jgi:hypothetical protein
MPVSELKTVTESAAGAAKRLSGMAVLSVPESTKVVGSDSPFKRTTDELSKPLPLAVIVTEVEPATTEFGEIDWSTGVDWPISGPSMVQNRHPRIVIVISRVHPRIIRPFSHKCLMCVRPQGLPDSDHEFRSR